MTQTRSAHLYLKYLCDKVLQTRLQKNLDAATEEALNRNLISVIALRQQKPLEDFLYDFINHTEDPSLTQEMAKLIMLLTCDAPISSVVPFR